MKLHELFRGARLLFGPDQAVSQLLSRRGSLRVPHAAAIVFAVVLAVALSGCNDYNPNLGASATYSSSITQIVPSSRYAGCSGFTLDVIGSGFVNGATVQWNGNNLATLFESDTEMLGTVPQSYLTNSTGEPVSVSITVSVPGQSQGNDQSNSMTFTTNPPQQGNCPAPPTFLPNITNIDPNSGIVGTTVTITGQYFGGVQNTSTVAFGSTQATITATTNWSATTIITSVPTGVSLGANPVVVNVGGLTNTYQPLFTVIPTPAYESSSSIEVGTRITLYPGVGNPLSVTPGARYVAYVATSSDPATSGDTGLDKIFLHDTCQRGLSTCTPQTLLVSVGLGGAAPNAPSRAPSVSADGRFVAFASDATNLVPGDDNGASDVFIRDTCLGAGPGCLPSTTRISLGPGGNEANGASSSPAISADGRYVAFQSFATNLTLDAPPAPTKTAAGFLRDTCFGVSGPCTPATTRLTPPSLQ